MSSGSRTSTPPAPYPPITIITDPASPSSSGRRGGLPRRARHPDPDAGALAGASGSCSAVPPSGAAPPSAGATTDADARSAGAASGSAWGSVDPSTDDGGFMTRSMLA
ncbi:hypothetical protein GCM10009608_17510 [Pseudonocardia alaniniphila]